MVYERFIVVNGEKYGPYYYESYRDKDGKVVSRRLKDYRPEKKDVVEIHKKSRKKIKRVKNVKRVFLNLVVIGLIFGMIFMLVSFGGINKIAGFVVSEIADEEVVESFDNVVDLEVRESLKIGDRKVGKNKNKRMDFGLADGGNVRLYFDLLNYSEFVEEVINFEENLSVEEVDLEEVRVKSEELDEEELEVISDEVVVDANEFEIVVDENVVDEEVEKEYKWGYKVRLDDLNFMAKIDVSSDEDVAVYDEYSLKVGNTLLSFQDLIDAGYNVRIESPSLESEVGNLSESLTPEEVLFEGNVSLNLSEEEVNVSFVEVNLTDGTSEGVPSHTVPGTRTSEEVPLEGNVSDDEIEEEADDNEVEEEVDEESGYGVESKSYGIIGNVIRSITGYIVGGGDEILEIDDEEYGNKISIFIEKDFRNNSEGIKAGDVVYLDPFLIILISEAEHLDVNRSFVADIYEDVREQDGSWSEVIGEGEFVRVWFEQNLTKDKDITVYARGVNGSSGIEVYREGDDEMVAEIVGVDEEGWYKTYLDGSSGAGLDDGESVEVFDLKVVDGFGIEFDYIVDPEEEKINFTNPTPFSGDLVYDNLLINLSFMSPDSFHNATIDLYYSNGSLLNSTVNSTDSPFFLNFSDLSSGVYYFNATGIDSNNENSKTFTRNVVVLNPNASGNGTVSSSYKVNESRFGNGNELNGGFFGSAIANLGDLDGDGVQDLVVGERSNDDGETSNGAVWILNLNTNGSIKSSYKINSSRFGNGSELSGDNFGNSVANIGDLDNDGVQDIVVGDYLNDDGGADNGAVWILNLNTNGSVKSSYKINESRFGNGNELSGGEFGSSVANIGDLNNDGVVDLAVGESQNDDGGEATGAVWILFLNTSGGVIDEYKINSSKFGSEFSGIWFGSSVANIGDLNNDGVSDLAVGVNGNSDGGFSNGAVWILNLNTNGSIKSSYKINESRFGNGNELSGGNFGSSVANIGDLNNDGVTDIAVGEFYNDDGESANGAVWILFLNTSGGVIDEYKINSSRFGNGSELSGGNFGSSVANLGDLNNDGVQDIVVGEYANDDGGASNGAIWFLFLDAVVDSIAPDINFSDSSVLNETSTNNMSVEINVSIVESELDEVKYNWNGTNFTLFNDSLVLMYNFDNVSSLGENSTQVVDLSGNGNNGTWIGEQDEDSGVNTSDCKFGSCRMFDGEDYVNTNFEPNYQSGDKFTVSMWIYAIVLQRGEVQDRFYGGFVENGTDDPSILLQFDDTSCSDGEILFFVRDDDYNSSDSICSSVAGTGFWAHIVAVYNDTDNKNMTIYINGVKDATIAITSESSGQKDFTGNPLYIGGSNNLGALFEPLNGLIDEVRIYNRSLSNDEIYQLYVSNLRKFDSENWSLYVNQSKNAITGFDSGDYTYYASAKDLIGNENITEVRSLEVNRTLNISSIVAVNESSVSGGSVIRGDNVTINATIVNATEIDSVWVVVWSGVVGSSIVWQGFMSFIAGIWSVVVVVTDAGFSLGEVNYTVYVNGTDGQEFNLSGNFTALDVPSIEFNSLTPFSGDLLYEGNILVNVSFANASNATINLYDSLGALVNSTVNNSGSPFFLNFSGLSSGVYYFNVTGLSGDVVNNSVTRNVLVINPSASGNGSVKLSYKINESRFGNGNELNLGEFGSSIANLGDLDGDGIQDIAVGEFENADGDSNNGAVWILFLNTNRTVKSSYKINESRFGNGNELSSGRFGSSITNLGDLDGDGIQDIAVGEFENADGDSYNGAVWILNLNTNGSVKSSYKINESRFGNGNELSGDKFGISIANLGDLDRDGVQDIAVGDFLNDDGESLNGAIWILFLNTNGTVKSSYKINESRFGNGNELGGNFFGGSIANLGDLDGDGIQDIAVGETSNDDGGNSNGAIWILNLNTNGSVKSSYKINESRFGNGNELSNDGFGISIANLGDLDGDGVQDIVVGGGSNDDGGDGNGAFWIFFMNINGTVKSEYKINESRFGNGNELDGNQFGYAVANLGDLDGDGIQDIAVGEKRNDDGGGDNGAIWILNLFAVSPPSVSFASPTSFSGDLIYDDLLVNISFANVDNATINLYDSAGALVNSTINDSGSPFFLNFSGLSSGVYYFNASGFSGGSVNNSVTRNVLVINPSASGNGSVGSEYKINESRFGNGVELDGGKFGSAVANLGDLDGDGVQDIAVGEEANDEGKSLNGAVWILFLNINGSVKSEYKINESRFGDGDELDGDSFGSAVANIGDLNGDGVQDIAVGEYSNDDGGAANGAVWILFLNISGGVIDEYKINESRFGNGDELGSDWFGSAVANIGDLDGDGIQDIAVGAYQNNDGGAANGAVWILNLNTNGSVKSSYKINESRFGNGNELDTGVFGVSIANIGDLDGDGIQDIAVGESQDNDGGSNNGAVWILFLNINGSVKSEYKINESRFGNGNEIMNGSLFGKSVANIGDLNNDGIQDIAVGESGNDDGGISNGAFWILFLDASGGVIDEYKINESRFGNGSELGGDSFGSSIANLGDLNNDGIQDIIIGEPYNDDGAINNGAVWILNLAAVPPPVSPPDSGDGEDDAGGGGEVDVDPEDADEECVSSWICASWTPCSEGIQKRFCGDENECGDENMPPLSQECVDLVLWPEEGVNDTEPDEIIEEVIEDLTEILTENVEEILKPIENLINPDGFEETEDDSDIDNIIQEDIVVVFSIAKELIVRLAGGSGGESVLEEFDKQIDLKVKSVEKFIERISNKNKNKRLDFDLSGGKLRLYFDLLDYEEVLGGVVEGIGENQESNGQGITGNVVGENNETNLENVQKGFEDLSEKEIDEILDEAVVDLGDDFEITIDEEKAKEHNVEYKWGYKVKLNDLNFIAKIDVTSEEDISLWEKDSLKIGDNILSFKDLVDSGYSVRINEPSLDFESEDIVLKLKDVEKRIDEETGYGKEVNKGILKGFVREIAGLIEKFVIGQLEKDIKYGNEMTIYVERDFGFENLEFDESTGNWSVVGGDVIYEDVDNDGKISVGDIIDLDPSLIILISEAEHLDVNRSFVSNIYDDVKEKDGNWSEVINESEFVRVWFEENLTSDRDITVYARGVNGVSGIEVYREGGDEVVALFENVGNESWHKVYLDGSSGAGLEDGESLEVFDLKVVDGLGIEFDYIVDPDVDVINLTSPTAFSGDLIYEGNMLVNVSFSYVDNATINLYSSNGSLFNSTINDSDSPFFLNFTNLSSGVYYFNASGLSGGSANNSVTRNVLVVNPNASGDGSVKSSYKINESRFGNGNELDGGRFGSSVANIGDLDGDGVQDLVVGEDDSSEGGAHTGVVWIMFMNINGSVKSSYKINESRFGNGDELGGGYFGSDVSNLGDLDGDGVQDIAVGEPVNGDGGASNGVVWILNLNTNGGVKSSYKINESRFGNGDELSGDAFGYSVANLGDLDGDGVQDIAVGEVGSDDGWTDNGAVWILNLNSNSSVKSSYKINESRFGNGDEISCASPGCNFGGSVANIGDLDGDGVQDIAVGELMNNDGDMANGALWILNLNSNSSVKSSYKINESRFGNGEELSCSPPGCFFGTSVANIGDLDNDGVQDIVVGEPMNADGDYVNGAVWILNLNSNGSVKSSYKINESRFGNGDELSMSQFGTSVANIGDLDNDGVQDIVVGESIKNEGGSGNGVIWILNLDEVTTNVAPNISYVSPLIEVDPIEASSVSVDVNVTVNDADGIGDIDVVYANFTRDGEAVRKNSSCLTISGESTVTSQNYSCVVDMWYWDGEDEWNISVYVNDSEGASGMNDSINFTYNQLKSINVFPPLVSFNVSFGIENQTANEAVVINNTGNYNATGKIGVYSVDLFSSSTSYISSGNITVEVDTGYGVPSPSDCDGTVMQNATNVEVSDVILERGNLSLGLSNETLYYCLKEVPSGISSGIYDTSIGGSWNIVLNMVLEFVLDGVGKWKNFVETIFLNFF
jgi:hypothetical protein